ncbi:MULTISPECIES: hypothetical protein [unclassified Corallococcus]|uniref:hypothetical protein n=1 Tax=unclassified Corallococcus TaxID=2685029 RepID=UPI001A8DDDF7|nr:MULTISPECIES: hypothetical protein [unclassified Corallococcus]MBN9688060.1 hypothetical protein [Corallococcus sp. NCSPR001]WAS88130.1 hypothetical protein O0N60_14380 [Corallococcus sp. NCRR]
MLTRLQGARVFTGDPRLAGQAIVPPQAHGDGMMPTPTVHQDTHARAVILHMLTGAE